jgi:hypothetical protein
MLGALLLAASLSACGDFVVAPSYEVRLAELHTLAVPARSYNSVAWLGPESIALSYGDEKSSLAVIDRAGADKGELDVGARPECDYRYFLTLARLPSGELGLTDVCGVPGPETELNDFVAVDLDSGVVRSLGRAAQPPFSITWREDMTAVYAAGDHLCATLYTHGERDAPLDLEVDIDGQRFKVGQDLTATPDRCPSGGRAGHPAYSPDGRSLAFMASANGTSAGQDLLDLPWAIFVTDEDGSPTPVFEGVRYPGELIWLSDGETLVFSGELGGRRGVWQVDRDGSGLALLADAGAYRLSPAPDGGALVALVATTDSEGTNEVVLLDLPSDSAIVR